MIVWYLAKVITLYTTTFEPYASICGRYQHRILNIDIMLQMINFRLLFMGFIQ